MENPAFDGGIIETPLFAVKKTPGGRSPDLFQLKLRRNWPYNARQR
jgi:hypothetical protein